MELLSRQEVQTLVENTRKMRERPRISLDKCERELDELDLKGAIIHDDTMDRSLDEALLDDVEMRGFFTDSSFFQASITNATLRGVDFSRSCFIEANLEGADLTGANLFAAQFTDAILTNVKLNQVRMYWNSVDLVAARLRQIEGSDKYETSIKELLALESSIGYSVLIEDFLSKASKTFLNWALPHMATWAYNTDLLPLTLARYIIEKGIELPEYDVSEFDD